MDEFLELVALLELISSGEFTSSRDCISMTLSEFYEKYILSKDGLDCKHSSFGSTLKWAKATHKKGLLVVEVDKWSHVALIVSVGSSANLYSSRGIPAKHNHPVMLLSVQVSAQVLQQQPYPN